MHLQATFALHGILEKYHLNREAFEWVSGEVEAKFNHDCKSYFYLFFWSASHILIVISRVQLFARMNNCKPYFDCDFWSAIVRTYERLQVFFLFFWSAIVRMYKRLQVSFYFLKFWSAIVRTYE
jgi:hypothetical protein